MILESLAMNPGTSNETLHWAHKTTINTYAMQMHALIEKHSGQQFSARHATADNLKEFNIRTLAAQMRTKAPHVWQLLDILFSADLNSKAQRDRISEKRRVRRASARGHVPHEDAEDSEAEYWRDQDTPDQLNGETEDIAEEQREALITIVSFWCCARDSRYNIIEKSCLHQHYDAELESALQRTPMCCWDVS
jgi:hypothetical protein